MELLLKNYAQHLLGRNREDFECTVIASGFPCTERRTVCACPGGLGQGSNLMACEGIASTICHCERLLRSNLLVEEGIASTGKVRRSRNDSPFGCG